MHIDQPGPNLLASAVNLDNGIRVADRVVDTPSTQILRPALALRDGVPTTNRSPLPFIFGFFVVAIVSQRLGIWIGGLPFAAALGLLISGPMLLAVGHKVRVVPMRLYLFLGLVATTAISMLLNSDVASLPSWLLLCGLYAPFCVATPLVNRSYRQLQRGLTIIALGFGLVGVAQYVGQFALAQPAHLFSWAWIIPSSFLIEYNSLNKLNYFSTTYKSNGFFFLEASAVSQLLARMLLIGRWCGSSWRTVALIIPGIAVTYSGGGMVQLGLFIIPLLLHEAWRSGRIGRALGYYVVVFAVAVAGLMIVSQAGILRLDTLLDRVGEWNTPGTSGWARYGSSGLLIERGLSGQGLVGLLFGIGPGRIEHVMTGFRYEVFATAWVKLVVEYGVLGSIAFMTFLIHCVWSSSRSVFITLVLLMSFVLLDSNILVPQYVLILFLIGVLPQKVPDERVSPLPRENDQTGRHRNIAPRRG